MRLQTAGGTNGSSYEGALGEFAQLVGFRRLTDPRARLLERGPHQLGAVDVILDGLGPGGASPGLARMLASAFDQLELEQSDIDSLRPWPCSEEHTT